MYHVEGAGGGHSPDLLVVNGRANVIPSSTNPFTACALNEGVPMTMLCHILNYRLPEDVAFAECRVRPQSMAAEDMLHDMGAISIFATDSQGMGRLAENSAKCWGLASVMKERIGRLAEETTARADNERIKRYVAKLTVNSARAVGIDEHVGSIQPGRMADLVLWPRHSFGAKPSMVIKAGVVAWSAMGDGNGNGSHIGVEPVIQRPMWGALGSARTRLGVTFVSKLAVAAGTHARLGALKPFVPIENVRGLRKRDMVRNDVLPRIEVDPRTFEVRADGRLLSCPPARKVPLAQRHFLR